jgi:DNA-binding NarL/FixJ family response regulator
MKKIRLLLIEDNRLLRDGIIAMLKNHHDIKILASTGNNQNMLLKIQKLNPNIILLDLGLRNQNSLTVVEVVKKDFPNAKVIVMDLAPVQADINLFLKAGASGFILKDATLTELLSTIRVVSEGENVLPPDLNETLFSKIVEHGLKGGKVKLSEAVKMTKREREVIGLIGDGFGNKDIGQKMHISTFTVKSHIHNIMEKLFLHTRLEVANYSYSAESFKSISKNLSMINN